MQAFLDGLYGGYNRRHYVHPDPLELVYPYDDLKDREIAALIAACLAYGRVAQILKSISSVLTVMGPSPFDYLKDAGECRIKSDFASFVHRFARGSHLSALLIAIKRTIAGYGTLGDCFGNGYTGSDRTVLPALTQFVSVLKRVAPAGGPGHLVASPDKQSACKRLHLFLRWMVRCDAVDPGGWDHIPPSKLIVPVDVHMHRIGCCLGLTDRKQADLKAALALTAAFRRFAPIDPVRYDFALTRFGIREDLKGRLEYNLF